MTTVDLVITSGQSQMSGVGTGTDAPNTNPALAWEWNGGPGFLQVDDPGSSSAPYKPQTGSCLPSFSNAFTSYSGRPIVVVRAAIGGTALLASNATANGDWSPTGSLFGNSVTRALAAMSALSSAGHTVDKIFSIMSLGYRDASGGHDLTTFGEATSDILDRWKTALSRSDFKLYLEEMYAPAVASPTIAANCLVVKGEQHDAVDASDGDIQFAFTEGSTFKDRGWLKFDQLHYNQTGLNYMGFRFAEHLANDFGFTSPEEPPEITPIIVSSVLARRLLQAPAWTPPPDPVASPVFAAGASWSVGGSVATVSGTASALGTISAGDYLVAHCWANTGSCTWTRAGWTLLAASGDQAIFGKLATGSETNSDFSFTRSNTTNQAGVSVQRYTGVDPTTPVEVVGGVTQAVASTSASGTSLTLTGGTSNGIYRRAVQFAAKITVGAATWTAPGGTTKHYDATASGSGLVSAGGSKEVGSGATGNFGWSVSAAGGTRGAVVILVPPPGP